MAEGGVSMTIQQYSIDKYDPMLVKDEDGNLVFYADHLAKIAEKDKVLESKEKALDNNEATIRRLSSEIARLKGLLAEAVAALETILFLSDAPSCHVVARTILGLEKIGESHDRPFAEMEEK
jgi:hypothetical protein